MSRALPGFRRPLTLLAGAALLAPLALTGVPRASAAEQYTVTALEFTVRAGDRSCTVDADLYRPAGVDARNPAPAVLATNGFGGSKSDGSTDVIGRSFAEPTTRRSTVRRPPGSSTSSPAPAPRMTAPRPTTSPRTHRVTRSSA